MQNLAPNMDVLSTSKSRRNRHLFVPIALVIVLLTSLFSFVGSQETPSPKLKTVYAADVGGGGHGGQAWCRSQAWVDKIIQERQRFGEFWRFFDYWDWVLRMGSKICTPRPDNPAIDLGPECRRPEITVALLVDRSNSVIADGSSITPELYTRSLNTLIDEFYDRFTPDPRNGHVNFLIYAFGSKAVLQNDTTDNGMPVLASNLITDASTFEGRQAMLDTISKIHFRDEAVPAFADKNWPNSDRNGFQHSDGSLYQRQRAYNLGSETKGGEYGMTNWQDAFINVMDAGSSAKYNDSAIGKHIDLAVMVTDGLPTAENSSDWTWTPGTFKGSDTISYNPAADGIDYADADSVDSWNANYSMTDDLYRITTGAGGRSSAKSAVDMLRTGANPHSTSAVARNIPERPPISVKGIVVTTNPSPAERNRSRAYARDVFADTNGDNFFFATDFTTTLEEQIKSLVTEVIQESSCPELNEPVENSITLKALAPKTDPNDPDVEKYTATPTEGSSDFDDIVFRVTNNGSGPLTRIILCDGEVIPEFDENGPHCNGDIWEDSGPISLEPGEYKEFTRHFYADFGQSDKHYSITAIGTSSADDFVAGSYPNSKSETFEIWSRPIRLNLPA